MRTHDIAVIAGDGIGPEVIAAGKRVLDSAAHGFSLRWHELDWSCARHKATGAMMPPDGLAQLAPRDAIYLGAVGHPSVPDHVSLWGLLLPIRQAFQLYANVRPVRLLPGVPTVLSDTRPTDIDMVWVRENTEGEYAGVGGRIHEGAPAEVATQTSVFTRAGTERVARYAFELARTRPRKLLASCTKSNALRYTAVLWDEVVESVGADFPDVRVEKYLVDALAARMVTHPETLDVVVASNLFADILTDLGGAIAGSLGMAASANLDPTRTHPSLFEPVHGSAPDITGKGIANPAGAVWAGAMMLEHLREHDAARHVMHALEVALADPANHTPDLHGIARTEDVTRAIIAALA
ncbi:MAG: tartrate dehydrogenase [Chloroflexi bacterium 13_1_40CM_4_68_4]|nr:MAG: tartrate dehydrogenase [Chloroflexi bacterium 13_1_40CM_4_68_4]